MKTNEEILTAFCKKNGSIGKEEMDLIVEDIYELMTLARQASLDEAKERGWWSEGEGINRKVFKIDVHTFPHDEGCEGSMCYCSSRARRNGYEYLDGKWNTR